jgi:DNA anti-recombination protein RmuC
MAAGAEEEDEGEDVKSMFQSMMEMMKSVKSELSEVKTSVGQASSQATKAVEVAVKAAEKVDGLSKTVDDLSQKIVNKDEVQGMIDQAIELLQAKRPPTRPARGLGAVAPLERSTATPNGHFRTIP